MEFDFDAWARLAKDDPAEFERRRGAVLQASIASAPTEHRQRLEGLQFQIDMTRNRSGTALATCLKLQAMMWTRFFQMRDALNGLAEGKTEGDAPKQAAEVISLQQFARTRRSPATSER